MKYIDKEARQLIIDTPIYKTITKTIAKNGKTKDNIKYRANIPKEAIIYMIEDFKSFDIESDDDIEFIDAIINEKLDKQKKYYLSFYDHPGKDYVEVSITDGKVIDDNNASVTIKKQVKSDSYYFTVSKKIFNELKDNNNSVSFFRFIISLDYDSYCFKNSIIQVKLI